MSSKFMNSAGIAALLLAVGCTSPDAKTAESTGELKKMDSSAMANMPGMNMKDAVKPQTRADSDATPDEKAVGKIAQEITMTASQIQHGGIKWAPAVMGNAAETVLIPGTLVPNEDHTVRLGAPAGGRIVKVFVRPGDVVRTGQVLVTIQSPAAGMAQAELSKAVAQVNSTRAEAQYASAARARAERLLALKAIPRQEYERAITDDEQARAALAQAEAETERARTTARQLGTADGNSGEIALRAPTSGVVLSRTAVPGTVIEPGAPLVTVTDPSTLWLAINAPETMSKLFTRGAPLRFTIAADPTDTLAAKTEAVGVGLDEATRTLTVRALVANRTGRLKAEMIANVMVSGGASVPAVWLPDDAVQSIDGKSQVFIVSADANGGAKITRREVTTGARAAGKIPIFRGLAAGEIAVTTGAFAVKSQFQKAAMSKMEM